MRRRPRAALAFTAAAVLATAVPGLAATAPAPPFARPRLLVAAHDPFSGLDALRARYAKGARPSDDLPGWALTYLLTGDEASAKKALAELPQAKLRGIKGSNRYLVFLWKALAFDWLYSWPGFDAAAKDRVAKELVDGAAEVVARQSLTPPAQASYHNHAVRDLALAAFGLWAVEGHPSVEDRAAPLRAAVDRALDNALETTELVNPRGGYHESTDYMRITWAPLALLAEMRRTRTGDDPARRYGAFASMGTTYLYKLLPDGSCARDDDDEFPHLDEVDSVVLGYAVHRFKDPYAAFLLRKSGWLPATWRIPVLQFLWDDPEVVPRDPAATSAAELPRHRLFTGIGHLVIRDGWTPESTWIELTCGPYFAKHDHLDAGTFSIYRKGHLAIDSGADYTDTESPHYLGYYRRTVAHNTMLVYQPGESFFWSENRWTAVNDGGQRMDSSRFWNSVRSLDDWQRTRDLWDRCTFAPVESAPGDYHYARADATRAYQPSKLERFTREFAYLEPARTLVVLDRVRSADPSYRKAWLLHGVNEPRVEGPSPGAPVGAGGTSRRDATLATFEEGGGRLRVHTLLPRGRDVVARGGPGFEFWTPGDAKGGPWGSGQNWPLEPAAGGPVPDDPYLKDMWTTFWGGDFKALAPSNRRAVVPGGWRIEVSPAAPAKDDVFLSVLEIGDRDGTPARRVAAVEGHGVVGASIEGASVVLFADGRPADAEATLPALATTGLLVSGLVPRAAYEAQLTSGFAPGAPLWSATIETTDDGTLRVAWSVREEARLRLRRPR